jgi:RNA processing factor Prp31
VGVYPYLTCMTNNHTAIKNTKDEMLSLRMSSRIMRRLRKAADSSGQQVSELSRQAILRAVERIERLNGGANG